MHYPQTLHVTDPTTGEVVDEITVNSDLRTIQASIAADEAGHVLAVAATGELVDFGLNTGRITLRDDNA